MTSESTDLDGEADEQNEPHRSMGSVQYTVGGWKPLTDYTVYDRGVIELRLRDEMEGEEYVEFTDPGEIKYIVPPQ